MLRCSLLVINSWFFTVSVSFTQCAHWHKIFKFLLNTDTFAFHCVVEFFSVCIYGCMWWIGVSAILSSHQNDIAFWYRKKYCQSQNIGSFFFIHFSIQANVLNGNKNYDAFVEKKHRWSEAAINHGANAFYFQKLRLNRNIKKMFDE